MHTKLLLEFALPTYDIRCTTAHTQCNTRHTLYNSSHTIQHKAHSVQQLTHITTHDIGVGHGLVVTLGARTTTCMGGRITAPPPTMTLTKQVWRLPHLIFYCYDLSQLLYAPAPAQLLLHDRYSSWT